jgi:hypothetical protein
MVWDVGCRAESVKEHRYGLSSKYDGSDRIVAFAIKQVALCCTADYVFVEQGPGWIQLRERERDS